MHTLLLDGADPVLSGPADTGGSRAVETLLVVGEGLIGPAEGAGEQPELCWACAGPAHRWTAPVGYCSPSATGPPTSRGSID